MNRPSSLLPLLAFMLCLTFASACANSSPQETSNTSRNESPVTYRPSSTPTTPPITSTNPTASATPYDPVNDHSEEGIRQNILAATESPQITYEQLKKNADRYDGEPWAFTGKIFQIQESGGQTLALVSLDQWGSKIVAVKANFITDFVEKDRIYVVGYVTENYSYTSVANLSLSVPAMDARAILEPAEAARIKAGKKDSKQ